MKNRHDLSVETLYQGDWLRLCREGTHEYVKRVRSRASAIIIAVNDKDEIILVEQYRIPVGAKVLELPAGLVGDIEENSKETIVSAASRELLEETGYEAKHMKEVAAGPISSGLSGELMTFCYAEHLIKCHAGGGDETENITVHEVPLTEIHSYLAEKQKKGFFIDPKIYIGLYFIHLLRK